MIPLSVKDLQCKGKKVLLRVDFNVPFDNKGNITDLSRIKESLPTIRHILEEGGTVILLSHRGRPKGKDLKYTLEPCAKALSALLQEPVLFASDCLGGETAKKIAELKEKEVLLLENLRFYPAEEKPELDPSFAKTLSSYGDVYVNDAFGAAHRPHSSIVPLAKLFPANHIAMGFLMEKEIKALSTLLYTPPTPFHLILGGAKISSKLPVITALLPKIQALYLGGAMSFTFLKALGYSIGDSLFEQDFVDQAKNIISLCKKQNINLYLPIDIIAQKTGQETQNPQTFSTESGLLPGWQGMDVGIKTTNLWATELKVAKSIFWNGPLGVFENPLFAQGTFTIAKTIALLQGVRIVGGGDSIAAIESLGLSGSFTHISTGGGASLEFLEKGTLPGIEALTSKEK